MRKLHALVLGSALMLGLTSTTSAAAAERNPLQEQINQVLAATEGGVQISAYEIAWNNGEVIMSFPLAGESKARASSPAAQRLQAKVADKPEGTIKPATADSTLATYYCPTEYFGNDWYCFYEHKDYGGRRLQWNAAHPSGIDFWEYDFGDKTSSWSNEGGLHIEVDTGWIDGPRQWIWFEGPHSKSPYVGDANNDRADIFYAS